MSPATRQARAAGQPQRTSELAERDSRGGSSAAATGAPHRSAMRRQLGVATAPLVVALMLLLGGPALFVTWPDLAAHTLSGLALTWLLVGGAVLTVLVTALVAVCCSERRECGVRGWNRW